MHLIGRKKERTPFLSGNNNYYVTMNLQHVNIIADKYFSPVHKRFVASVQNNITVQCSTS